MTFFCFLFLVIEFFKKKLFCINEITKGFHMRYHSFLHYGWFLQNLGKDFIPTNMHTTVVFCTEYFISLHCALLHLLLKESLVFFKLIVVDLLLL